MTADLFLRTKEEKLKVFPREMKRLSKPMPFTQENINRVPNNAHGVYVIRDEAGVVLYIGIA